MQGQEGRILLGIGGAHWTNQAMLVAQVHSWDSETEQFVIEFLPRSELKKASRFNILFDREQEGQGKKVRCWR
jgi:hypothetical protein